MIETFIARIEERATSGKNVKVPRVMPLLRAEGREEEAEVGLETAEDGRTPEAEAMVLPLAPDEALVVNVT